jgi:hypothetical protein
VPQRILDYVNWDAIYCAMRESPKRRRVIITKQLARICGVRKYMKLWKKQDSEACPRCGLPEDASHVWKCNGSGAKEIWDKAIGVLANWLSEASTDPDIEHAIISNLRRWREGEPPDISPGPLQVALSQQADIGWGLLIEGWCGIDWAECQQTHYQWVGSRKSGKRWACNLIKRMWDIGWTFWEHRNEVLHHQDYLASVVEEEKLNSCLQQLFHLATRDLKDTRDGYLVKGHVRKLLRKPEEYKKVWETRVKSALQAARTRRSNRYRDLG